MKWIVGASAGIDGPEDMKLIFGIIVVDGKGNRGKEDKVELELLLGFPLHLQLHVLIFNDH